MVINTLGQIRQLFIPFKAEVLITTGNLKKGSTVFVENVQLHHQYKLIYRVGNNWYPYNIFNLKVRF